MLSLSISHGLSLATPSELSLEAEYPHGGENHNHYKKKFVLKFVFMKLKLSSIFAGHWSVLCSNPCSPSSALLSFSSSPCIEVRPSMTGCSGAAWSTPARSFAPYTPGRVKGQTSPVLSKLADELYLVCPRSKMFVTLQIKSTNKRYIDTTSSL